MNMGTITIIRKYNDKDNYHDMELTFDLPDDATIKDVHYAMRQAAMALGYTEYNVEAYFDEPDFSE